MNVSIIICTRNRAASLDQTLESLETVTVPAGLSCEILVVDNGSTDGTRELVQQRMGTQSSLRYVLEASPGQSRARNAGLSQSTGDIFIFTDDDIRFPQCWLRAICDPIIQGKGHAVAGKVELAPQLERKWMALRHRSWCASTERMDSSNPSDMVGASMAFHRSVLERVPGFDNELGPGASGFADDTLFSWQLKEAGFRIVGAPEAVVIHHFHEDRLLRKNWLSAARAMGRTQAYLLYHWFHDDLKCPRLWRWWLAAKLAARRRVAGLPQEGLLLWELSYIYHIEKRRQFEVERNRPRNYAKRGLRKLVTTGTA
jgi:glucosyl-dolichyl phosphate glucuronosyltransferase